MVSFVAVRQSFDRVAGSRFSQAPVLLSYSEYYFEYYLLWSMVIVRRCLPSIHRLALLRCQRQTGLKYVSDFSGSSGFWPAAVLWYAMPPSSFPADLHSSAV